MKWLILQSAGEHIGNDGWCRNDYLRECWAWKYALEQNKQEVDVYGKRHNNYPMDIDYESYDVILVAEQYETEWLPDLSEIKKPIKIQWVVDAHIDTQMYLNIMSKCDIVLHATKLYVEEYKNLFPNKKHLWFPNAVDDRYFNTIKNYGEKENYFRFVGSLASSRKEFIDNLVKDAYLEVLTITGEEMLKAISTSKVHFNKSVADDIPYRVFETIGLGTCLITDYKPEMEELGFVDGLNCYMYNDYEECKSQSIEALRTGRWKRIGEAGYELSKQHTYTERVKRLLKEM